MRRVLHAEPDSAFNAACTAVCDGPLTYLWAWCVVLLLHRKRTSSCCWARLMAPCCSTPCSRFEPSHVARLSLPQVGPQLQYIAAVVVSCLLRRCSQRCVPCPPPPGPHLSLEASKADVKAWLCANGFSAHAKTFRRFNGRRLLELSVRTALRCCWCVCVCVCVAGGLCPPPHVVLWWRRAHPSPLTTWRRKTNLRSSLEMKMGR